jgi:hypothetical protein
VKEREIVASDLQKSGYTESLIPVRRLDAHQYVALRRHEVVRWVDFPLMEKKTYYERKIRKNGTDQHDEDVDLKFNHMVINCTPINERLCVIRIKGRFFNYSLINIPVPTNDSEEEAKDHFYEQLE